MLHAAKMIGVAQIRSTKDTAHNFEQCKLVVERATRQNVKLLCLPECFAFIGEEGKEALTVAENIEFGANRQSKTGPLLTKYRELAKSNKIWLSMGGFHERAPQEGKMYNTHLIIDNNGDIRALYRKIHLFKVQIPNGPNMDESVTINPGSEIVVCDSPVGRLGLTTCYDLRFPELYRALRDAGAQVLLVPSAFTVPTGKDHWEPLLRARAIENECYVVAAAQFGQHNPKRSSYGHACIIDPWGNMTIQCSDKEPDLGAAEIDLAYLEDVRKKIPNWGHRRPDLYSSQVVHYASDQN